MRKCAAVREIRFRLRLPSLRPFLCGLGPTATSAQQLVANPNTSLFVFAGVLNGGNLGQTVLVVGN
jgi:hypothetical protein